MFPDLREMAFHRRCPMHPSSSLPSVTRAICSRAAPYCVGPSAVVGLTRRRWPSRHGWPLVWLPGSALCSGCQPLVGKIFIFYKLYRGRGFLWTPRFGNQWLKGCLFIYSTTRCWVPGIYTVPWVQLSWSLPPASAFPALTSSSQSQVLYLSTGSHFLSPSQRHNFKILPPACYIINFYFSAGSFPLEYKHMGLPWWQSSWESACQC